MPVLIQYFDEEGKVDEHPEFIYVTLTAESLGKKPGDILISNDRKYVVIDVKKNIEDDRFDVSIDIVEAKKKADQ